MASSSLGKGLCRHCGRLPDWRPRGLCYTCYYDPAIRALYPVGSLDPATAKYIPRYLTLGGSGSGDLPTEATAAPPGSVAKMRVMRARLMQGVRLFHPGDNQYPVADLLGAFEGLHYLSSDDRDQLEAEAEAG